MGARNLTIKEVQLSWLVEEVTYKKKKAPCKEQEAWSELSCGPS
jgi:hypothetical protein